MPSRAEEMISQLELSPHPEGGYYREVFRSPRRVTHPETGGIRTALTGIYFLLARGQVSRWHRCLSDEIWHYHEGAPLEIWTAGNGCDRLEGGILSPPGQGGVPVRVVPAGHWQAARSVGDYTLVGCAVGPGFEFEDFQFLRDFAHEAQRLKEHHPAAARFL